MLFKISEPVKDEALSYMYESTVYVRNWTIQIAKSPVPARGFDSTHVGFTPLKDPILNLQIEVSTAGTYVPYVGYKPSQAERFSYIAIGKPEDIAEYLKDAVQSMEDSVDMIMQIIKGCFPIR